MPLRGMPARYEKQTRQPKGNYPECPGQNDYGPIYRMGTSASGTNYYRRPFPVIFTLPPFSRVMVPVKFFRRTVRDLDAGLIWPRET